MRGCGHRRSSHRAAAWLAWTGLVTGCASAGDRSADADPVAEMEPCCPESGCERLAGTPSPAGVACLAAQTTEVLTGSRFADFLLLPGTTEARIETGRSDDFVTTRGPTLAFLGGGDDVFVGGPASDAVSGGPGNDIILGGDGFDKLGGVCGNDFLHGGGGPNQIHGGPGNDVILGGPQDDVLAGDDGDDVILAGAGADLIVPGRGQNRVYGEGGDDRIEFWSDCEILAGTWIDGGPGTDVLASPLTREQLEARGVTLLSIEQIEIGKSQRCPRPPPAYCTDVRAHVLEGTTSALEVDELLGTDHPDPVPRRLQVAGPRLLVSPDDSFYFTLVHDGPVEKVRIHRDYPKNGATPPTVFPPLPPGAESYPENRAGVRSKVVSCKGYPPPPMPLPTPP